MDRLVESCRLDIESNEEQIRQLEKFRTEYGEVDSLLETIPKTLNPRVLVPLGSKCGFFYGYLKHTNEITAHLGDNYFSKMTAADARGLVSKRVKELDDQIYLLHGQKKHLDERMGIAKELSKENSESQEIKEPYSKDAEKAWMEKHKASVARERAAAKKEREKGISMDDPLKKLLEMKDEEDEEKVEKRVKWEPEVAVEKSPPKGEQSSNIRIQFRHSASTGSLGQPSSTVDAIQSPADVYAMFTSKPKSILKNKTSAESTPKQPAVEENAAPKEAFRPPSFAVSDKVVERNPVPLGAVGLGVNESGTTTRAASRFRRERNVQN